MKTCKAKLGVEENGNVREVPCGNRVLVFTDQQPDDICFRCFENDDFGFDPGSGYVDQNDGGLPK